MNNPEDKDIEQSNFEKVYPLCKGLPPSPRDWSKRALPTVSDNLKRKMFRCPAFNINASLGTFQREHTMRLSVNARYAIRLLCTLARSSRPVSLAALAESIGTSRRALENVNGILRRHCITEGSVGPRGGLVLKRDISEISIGQLLSWFDDEVDLCLCPTRQTDLCAERKKCPAHIKWKDISSGMQSMLDSVSLKDIMQM
ncbi:MAG: Rrf2 family transcriptional regulator [Desulfovibrio sp.]|nr:Rrf2 family transcriptional regulator [Desulfovibrio sp.]